MAGFIKWIFKGAKTHRLYDGYSAEARIWDPGNKVPKLVEIGRYKTQAEADAAIEGFLKAMNYHWGRPTWVTSEEQKLFDELHDQMVK